MLRCTLGTTLWLIVALATFNNGFIASANSNDENVNIDKLNILLSEESNRLSLDPHNQESHHFVPNEENTDTGIIDKLYPTSDEEGVDPKVEANENEDIEEAIRKQLRRNRITDILVGCFFFVAAVWLLLATCYSIILLILLRLQARGELDIYDEDLGRVVLFNGKITLHFGCILRRYAIQLEEDYQRQLQRRFGDSNTGNEEQQPIRIMTREERRNALEELLGDSAKTLDVECGISSDKNICTVEHSCGDASKKIANSSCPDTSLSSSEEEPVCSICLVEYEPTDAVFRSKSCPHMFHRECLFSWLERRNNTECPICRAPLVSDTDIWDVVQRMRKERREALRKENGLVHRAVKWMKSKRSQQSGHIHSGISSVETDRSDSSDSSDSSDIYVNRGSDDERAPDHDVTSSLPRELNPDDVVGDDTNSGDEETPVENSFSSSSPCDPMSPSDVVGEKVNDQGKEESPEVIIGDCTNDHDESLAENGDSSSSLPPSSQGTNPKDSVDSNTNHQDEYSAEDNV